ncbi:flagellar basal body P-ring protein FlgI [Duganella sp. BJB488]|uniref:flagellar basal body P-ring protein FlgI n=1 Tax=unclassified Duganella TaxID=2636909 RepID=UPI000E344925|nr:MULTISPECIES: flagellar basal body P-ring protein FlgI [unclassified Duganella]NVD69768.1 flagellar basal body P-ring protein FlgI [Duganella sp. BJB1802]RFP08765.1 flagellar basal body P-ring protein FlgI [Duganella sp. BJB489]RFP18181.1 flagellar basal body P-ring protein FlgI [Duganella sp. BJB488]RFP37942.1 flagellar basal body P-ring protein FlgI [Duganella sp. BJB480]
MNFRKRLSSLHRLLALPLAFCVALGGAGPVQAAQVLRNLVAVEGMRDNPLVGYGLVVGLNGSGDSTQVKFASQSVINMLKQFGVKVPDGTDAKSKNVATVMVSAVFPPGYRKGQNIDVVVSSMGDAKSLRGGALLLTPLRAADNEVYALAQGNVVVGGFSAAGKSGSSVTVNTPTSGRIPSGAAIEREIATDFATKPTVRLSLRHPHFQTAINIVDSINKRFGDIATTTDATSIDVVAPANPTQRVAFMAKLEALSIDVGDDSPKVVFNSRTGTVVIAEGLRVRAAAVTHGSLKVVISESTKVSQPNALAQGNTVATPQSQVSVDQGSGQMFKWPAGAKLQSIIDVVNSLGASPDDIMAILQALDQAGAIEGELVVI